ncbi:MAG: 2-oxoacid:acceptor oxidoreductase family protein [Candidatus Bathyarchaeia archaeon]
MPKRIEVRIGGLGGQGVVLAGEILGRAAVYEGKHVVETQSYGAEARGSAAKSEVIISDSKIGFPKVRRCDVLVAMSQSAVEMPLKDLKEKGVLIVDEDVVKHLPKTKVKVFKIPATKTAEKLLKSRLYANVVMLGALMKVTGIVKEEAVEKAITDSVPETAREANISGFREGLKLVAI